MSIQAVSRARLGISFLIVVVLALQASTFVIGTRSWPFMAYCMYSRSFKPGPVQTKTWKLLGKTASGGVVEIKAETAGLSFFALKDHYLNAMERGDLETARRLGQKLGVLQKQRFLELDLEIEEHSLQAQGVQRTSRMIVFPLDDLQPTDSINTVFEVIETK
jgi:hypothetical protein